MIRFPTVFTLTIAATAFGYAHAATPAERPITLRLENVSLREALLAMQDASGLSIAFAHDLVDGAAPVTLDVADEPVGEVLYRVLRERGLVPIQTSETMVGVIREESELGMAKRGGRALRVLAGLLAKLEDAALAEDAVRVPGWTEQDDRALAEALLDIYTFRRYVEFSWARPLKPSLDTIVRMTALNDADVGAGAGWLFGMTWWGEHPSGLAESHDFNALRLRLISDACPVVRACWIYSIGRNSFLPRVDSVFGEDVLSPQAYLAAYSDAVPFVRAALGWLIWRGNHQLEEMEYASLRGDESALVRLIVWRDWLGINSEPADLAQAARVLLAEDNPIARVAGLALFYSASRTQRVAGTMILGGATRPADEAIEQIYVADAWTDAAIGLLHPFMNLNNPPADEVFLGHALSRDRSRQMLALAALLTGAHFNNYGRVFDLPLDDVSELMALTKSERLIEQFLGLAGAVFTQAEDAEDVLFEVLNSQDRLLRLAALHAISISRHEPAAAIQKALLSKLDSPMLAERLLAAEALCRKCSFEDLHALYLEESARSADALTTQAIGIHMLGNAYDRDEEISARRREAVHSAISGTNNMLLNIRARRHHNLKQPIEQLADVIKHAAPEMLPSHTLGFNNPYPTSEEQSKLIQAAKERLVGMYETDDPVQRLTAVKLMLFPPSRDTVSSNEVLITFFLRSADGVLLKFRMVNDLVEPGNTDEEIELGLKLLSSLIHDTEYRWNNRPNVQGRAEYRDHLREPAIRALELVSDDTHGELASEVLAKLLVWAHWSGVAGNFGSPSNSSRPNPEWLPRLKQEGDVMRADTELMERLSTVEAYVLENGDANSRAAIYLARVRSYNPDVAKEAIADVERLVRDGSLRVETLLRAFRVLSWRADMLPHSLIDHMSERLRAASDSPDIRREIMNALYRAGHTPAMLDILTALVHRGRVDMDFCALVKSFVSWEKIAARSDQREVEVEWLGDAAALGKFVAQDRGLAYVYRRSGVELYIETDVVAPDVLIDELVLDESMPMDFRQRAATTIRFADLENIKHFTERYEELPLQVRLHQLNYILSNSQRNDALEEYVIRAIQDPDICARWRALPLIQMPLSDAVIAAFADAAAKDPDFAEGHAMIMRRYEWHQQLRRQWQEQDR